MKLQTIVLCAATVLTMALLAGSAQAQWGHYRVTSSYSLPSVPYAFQPVVVPVVQPTTAFSPVIVNQPIVSQPIISQPIMASQPVVVGRPVIVGRPVVVGQPVVAAPVVVRRGLFRRPVVVAPGAVPVATFPAPVMASPAFSAAPIVVQRPTFWVP